MHTLRLFGKLLTPVFTKKTQFFLNGCKVVIKNSRRRYYSKINTGKPMYPYSFICYLGDIELTYKHKSLSAIRRKLTKVLQIESIGRFHSEGMGKVEWIEGSIEKRPAPSGTNRKFGKVRIRKSLPHDLSEDTKHLIRYALLHDFANTPHHRSKIYSEPNLPDLEHLQNHHDKTNDPFIRLFQKYDRLAARITRKVSSPRPSRYNWRGTKNVDFRKLEKEIEEVESHPWKLYEYVYNSKELGRLNESLEHGHTSLRLHLLLMANLIVRDFQRNKLWNFSHTTSRDSVVQPVKGEGPEVEFQGSR